MYEINLDKEEKNNLYEGICCDKEEKNNLYEGICCDNFITGQWTIISALSYEW